MMSPTALRVTRPLGAGVCVGGTAVGVEGAGSVAVASGGLVVGGGVAVGAGGVASFTAHDSRKAPRTSMPSVKGRIIET
jgi:hypothetical protein